MKERPILFKGEMVQAILDGRKTQTRRVVKAKHLPFVENLLGGLLDGRWNQRPLPYGKPGDRLWVRETFLPDPSCDDDAWGDHYTSYFSWDGCGSAIRDVPPALQKPEHCIYRASWTGTELIWKPSIHMPRWASRILLEITSVRVERLRDISESDAKAEGLTEIEYKGVSWGFEGGNPSGYGSATGAFQALWKSINGDDSWAANPWVWVIEFKRVQP